jgi:hypothetical protein
MLLSFARASLRRCPPKSTSSRLVSTAYRTALENGSRVLGRPLADFGLAAAIREDWTLEQLARDGHNPTHPLLAALR